MAYHLGTTESSSNLHGLRELPSLMGEAGCLQVAHVAAYCRGMIEPVLDEVAEAISILGGLGRRAVSESYLSTKVDTGNATFGGCSGDDVSDHVTKNCLIMGGYEPTRVEMRRAIQEGYCRVFVERAGRIVMISGAEAEREWEAAGTEIGVSFPVTPPESALALMTAKRADGSWAIDALATDGGGIPRNWMVERGLALVRVGAFEIADYVQKASWTPARMLGLPRKGQLGVGADADVTVLDLERGIATMSFAGGRPLMIDGVPVADGGTLLVTEAGEAAGRASGVGYEVVDPRESLMYQ
jgi:amidohydrolase family protein